MFKKSLTDSHLHTVICNLCLRHVYAEKQTGTVCLYPSCPFHLNIHRSKLVFFHRMRAFEPNPPVTQAAHTMVQTMFFRGYFENELCSGAWFELGRTDSTKCVVSQTFYFQRPVSPHNTKKKKKNPQAQA